jgi:ribosomal protein L11 methyltransferase
VRPPGGGAWLELTVVADIEAVEAVSEILGRVASGGTSVEPAFSLVDEGLAAQIDPNRPANVRAYVPLLDPAAGERAVAQATEALGHLQAFDLRPIGKLTTRVVHEADWADAWKAHFPVLRIGRRLVVKPTWRHHRAAPDDIVLALDPGMAFGTGLHPTTRLCLAAVERLADDDRIASRRVLDVGCGSGILSIAAARLGADRVVGLDTDPIAVEATIANGRRNRVSRRIQARLGTLPSSAGPFDVVLANLIASPLVRLAPALHDELAPGGILVASGIFVDRAPEVRAAFEAAGLAVRDTTSEGDWVALEAVRTDQGGGTVRDGPPPTIVVRCRPPCSPSC